MIVKNEERTLKRCLESAGELFDQIVVVDTGSSDNTRAVAKSLGAEVYDFEWIDDFSKARNFSFSKSTCDYIMWLDADDVIEESQLKKLLELKARLGSQDMVMLNYAVTFDESGTPTFLYERERIFKRAKGYEWQGFIHEAIVPSGKIEHENIYISHKKMGGGDPRRNLKIYRAHIKAGEKLSPRDQYYYGKEYFYLRKYRRAITELKKSLKNGWLPNVLDAYRAIATSYSVLGEDDKALKALLESLSVAPPEPETCCQIGNLFLQKANLESARFWFVTALVARRQAGSFKNTLYDKFFPYLNLCVVEYRAGNYSEAKRFHELAKELNPSHPSVVYNEKIFGKI